MSGSTAGAPGATHTTLGSYGEERLRALLNAVGRPGDHPLLAAFRTLVRPWGNARVGRRPRFASNVADDGAPYEFSLALSPESAEVQFYVEPQGDPPGPRTNRAAGMSALDVAARELGAELEPVRAVQELLLPLRPAPPFSIWIGASWVQGSPLKLKAYLNPCVQGSERAGELVGSAMSLLGHGRAWSTLREALRAVPGRTDEVGIVSLDLSAAADARVKLYVRQQNATLSDVRRLAELASDYRADDLTAFYGALTEQPGPFTAKPVITELTFRRRGSAQPDSVTLEFPIQSYVPNDEVARERVCRCLSAFGVPRAGYERAIRTFATRPLERGNGIHAHVTLRRVPSTDSNLVARVGVYLTSEAYARGGGRVEHS